MRGIDKSFGKGKDRFKAVDDLNIDFFSNEVCAFLGHNGSGKTTSLSMITGIVRPERGEITVNGVNILEPKGTY